MSMYGMMFGENPLSDIYLAALGLRKADVGRFRNCFVSEGKIAVYTRNGGGNREHWPDDAEQDAGESCGCTGCVIEYRLPKHPNYLHDQDDDFDSTYATVYFSIPCEYKDAFAKLDSGEFKPDERWAKALDSLKDLTPEEAKARFPEIVALFDQIKVVLDKE